MLDRRRPDRDLLADPQPAGRRATSTTTADAARWARASTRARPARFERAGAAAADAATPRDGPADARLPVRALGDDDRGRGRPPARDRATTSRRSPRARGRPGQDGLPGRGRRRAARSGCRRPSPTTPRAACPSRELLRPVRPHPRPGRPARRRRTTSPTSAAWYDRLLGRAPTSRSRRDRGAPSVQQAIRFNLFSLAQATARDRRPGRPGEGRDRLGLRGPLLLGHRDLRHPVPELHPARGGPQRAALPLRACCRRPASGPARWPRAARCSRGGRSTARRPRRTTRPAPRRCTSTPTSPTR